MRRVDCKFVRYANADYASKELSRGYKLHFYFYHNGNLTMKIMRGSVRNGVMVIIK